MTNWFQLAKAQQFDAAALKALPAHSSQQLLLLLLLPLLLLQTCTVQ